MYFKKEKICIVEDMNDVKLPIYSHKKFEIKC